MRDLSAKFLLAAALVCGAAAPAWADFYDGATAFEAGDYTTILKEFRPLAELGHAYAQHNLDVMYDEGTGVPENDAEAVKWYSKAAEQGIADAQFNLGLIYAVGEGVTEDDAEAVKWFRLAAEQGDADAQNSLGLMYTTGEGVLLNYIRAYMWMSLAKTQGNGIAASIWTSFPPGRFRLSSGHGKLGLFESRSIYHLIAITSPHR